jgi:translation initiation factor 1
MNALVSNLKSICACGGTIKEGRIELQGDHRAKVKDALAKLGFVVEVI